MSGRGRWARPPVADRFWAKVNKTPGHGPKGDCWIWTGALTHNGYGKFWLCGRNRPAHQVAYELIIGATFTAEQVSRHSCDTPRCVRPDHVVPGTQAENIADRDSRGHTARGERSASAKLTARQVAEIRARYKPYYISRRRLAQEYAVSIGAVDAILDGETWKEEECIA